MTNRDLAHSFFYDLNGYKKPSRSSVWYQNGIFYSYSTAICRIFTRNDGQNVALFSENSFSLTTTNHLSFLKGACPFDRYSAFMDRGDDASEKELFETNKRYLEQYSVAKLTQKANREMFAAAFYALENFLEFTEFKPFYKNIKKVLKKYKTAIEQIEAIEKKRAEKEKKRQEQAEKKRQETLEKFKDLSYMEKIKTVFCSVFDYETRNELKNALNPCRDLSFVWVDGDKIRTSQQVTVDLKDAAILLKAWKLGKLKHGQTIDRYTVLSINPEFVKIGCHKIPAENLSELCRELNV